jgi:molybdopterin-binding protein
MANVKISGLPSATTPLAGTEVLPIVQGGVTDQVSVADLTVGRTVNASAFDTDVAAAGVTLSGTTLAADGTDANIDILVNTKGTGGVGIYGAPSGTVAGVTVTSNFCVKGEGTNPMAGFVHANNTTASSGSVVYACRSRGTIAAPTVVQNNDALASFVVAGFDGTDLALGAVINFEVDGTPGSNDMPTRMVFKTTPDGDQIPVEALRIDSTKKATFAGSVAVTNDTSLASYTETPVALGTVTSSATIAITAGTLITATLTASTACTFTMPTATAGKSFILLLKQAASTGNGTATFTDVKWGTAGAPTITAAAGKMDILTFVADGTNWYGSIAQGYTP